MRNCAHCLPHGMSRHNNAPVLVLRHQRRSRGEKPYPLDGSGLTFTIQTEFLLLYPRGALDARGGIFLLIDKKEVGHTSWHKKQSGSRCTALRWYAKAPFPATSIISAIPVRSAVSCRPIC